MTLFIVVHDSGYEGYSLPLIAFEDKAAALAWCKAAGDCMVIAEVPVFPELPTAPWYLVKAVTE